MVIVETVWGVARLTRRTHLHPSHSSILRTFKQSAKQSLVAGNALFIAFSPPLKSVKCINFDPLCIWWFRTSNKIETVFPGQVYQNDSLLEIFRHGLLAFAEKVTVLWGIIMCCVSVPLCIFSLAPGPKLYFLGVWHKYQRKDSHRRKNLALWQADICNREQRWTWSLPGMHICPGFIWDMPHVCFKETLLLDAFHAISFLMPA